MKIYQKAALALLLVLANFVAYPSVMTNTPSNNNKRNTVMRYAALGTELLVILGLAVWGGLWLDKKTGLSPLFLVVLPLLGLIVVFAQLIRSLSKK